MNNRSQSLLQLRPEIPSAQIYVEMSRDERFQNACLRPIIKFQNDLLIAAFRNYIAKHKFGFQELPPEKKLTFIENAIHKDIKFRNSLKGIVIGQFTIEEYDRYIANSSALNKRMMNTVIERLKDQVLLLEAATLV